MIRLLLLLLIVLFAGILWRIIALSSRPRTTRTQRINARMLKCDYCQVYVPEQEAVRDGERIYCGQEHRLLHRQENAK